MRLLSLLFFTHSFFTLSAITPEPVCQKLENGRYAVKFQTKGCDDYLLRVRGDQFSQFTKNGEQIDGEIEWTSDNCILLLKFPNRSDYWIELKVGKRKTTRFRMTPKGNLHITLCEGKFIKLKDFVVLK